VIKSYRGSLQKAANFYAFAALKILTDCQHSLTSHSSGKRKID